MLWRNTVRAKIHEKYTPLSKTPVLSLDRLKILQFTVYLLKEKMPMSYYCINTWTGFPVFYKNKTKNNANPAEIFKSYPHFYLLKLLAFQLSLDSIFSCTQTSLQLIFSATVTQISPFHWPAHFTPIFIILITNT